jgi:hypothetical protein
MKQELGVGDKQYKETPEEDEMVHPKTVFQAEDTALDNGIKNHVPDTLGQPVKAVIRLADG